MGALQWVSFALYSSLSIPSQLRVYAAEIPFQLRTRTFRTFMYATAAVLESWRNLYNGKAGLPTKAAVAGHRSVRRKTCRARLLSGRRQPRGQVGSRAEVDLVRGLAMECRMRHSGVVLLDVELHQGA